MDVDDTNANVKTDFIINEDGSITCDEITVPPVPDPSLTFEATKERLIIEKIVVTDFKSYAGTHTLGPFHERFTCIVGANGCGKSNVIDSLLFAFGYRAQKIRSKKISVLIHKSHKYPDLESCSVTVYFAKIKDNVNGVTIIPNSQFNVKRSGFIDNSSSYEINGKRAQYKDVAKLLRKYGIDLDYNRFMILQGEIELISMMKPKAAAEHDTGMLEYIEDIIGSNRFIKPIEHFRTKVEEKNELRLEKMNQLKIVEKERAAIEKRKDKALEYVKLENEIAFLRNSNLQKELFVAEKEMESINSEKCKLDEKLEQLSSLRADANVLKEVKDSELKALTCDYENCMKTYDALDKEFSSLEHQDVACRENSKSNKEKLKKCEKNLETEEIKISNLKKQMATLQNELKELEIKKKKAEDVRAVEEEKISEVMSSLKGEIGGFQEEKDELESELVKLKDIVSEKESELNLAEHELELILGAEKKEKEALESLKNDYNKSCSQIEEEKRSLEESEKLLHQKERDLASFKKKVDEIEKNEVNLSEEIKNKRVKLDDMKNSYASSQNRNTLVQAFMEQKAKGKLTGVYGRLGDLGAIDEKYDVAISTACGPLDNIVTDTIATAQECIEFLKTNNLGYATFIALDKMTKWEPYTKQKIDTPEKVPRLFDLIKVKNQDILPAFYFALRDTLVADNLEQATRVGLQGETRYRVVTLKGELIDLSGTMSGGGGRVLKGRMGRSVAASDGVSLKEIEKLTSELETLIKDATDSKMLKQELKDSILKVEKEIAQLKLSLKKSKSNVEAFIETSKVLSKQLRDSPKVVIDKDKVEELTHKIAERKKSFNTATKNAAVVEEQVKKLQDKILAVTKGKIGNVQKKVDKLTKEIETISEAIIKSNSLNKKAEKNLQKAEEKIESLKNDIENCKTTKENLLKEFEEFAKKGAEIVLQKEKLKEELEGFKVKKNWLSKEVKDISSKIHELKSEHIELKNEMKAFDLDLRAKQGNISYLKSELEKLTVTNIDEVEITLPTLTPEELMEVNTKASAIEIGDIERQMKSMDPDISAIAEFKRKDQMYRAKLKDFEDTVADRDHYKNHYDRLRKCRMDEFMKGFTIVSLKLKELYQMISLGGDAELELVDSLDPFSEGIEFSVRPFRKSWKNIRNLSGGEKTMSSLSLVFALHYYRSTPFFVMDEIDAALDFRNVTIIGSYIKEYTRNAQFIVISLRGNMINLADHFVGIYKTNNRTKNVWFNPSKLEKCKKIDESFKGIQEAKQIIRSAEASKIPSAVDKTAIETDVQQKHVNSAISADDNKQLDDLKSHEEQVFDMEESIDSFDEILSTHLRVAES